MRFFYFHRKSPAPFISPTPSHTLHSTPWQNPTMHLASPLIVQDARKVLQFLAGLLLCREPGRKRQQGVCCSLWLPLQRVWPRRAACRSGRRMLVCHQLSAAPTPLHRRRCTASGFAAQWPPPPQAVQRGERDGVARRCPVSQCVCSVAAAAYCNRYHGQTACCCAHLLRRAWRCRLPLAAAHTARLASLASSVPTSTDEFRKPLQDKGSVESGVRIALQVLPPSPASIPCLLCVERMHCWWILRAV